MPWDKSASRGLTVRTIACLSFTGLLFAGLSGGLGASLAAADDLPAATEKILADAKLSPALLDGVGRELAVPQAWLDGARKEGTVKFSSTFSPAEFKRLSAPFLARYPFIKVEYDKATAQQREMTMLVAYQSGRYLADVISSYGGAYTLFEKANALDDLRGMPGFLNLAESSRSPDGLWVTYRRQFFCTAYNTDLVKKEDLPKRWEDLLDNRVWRDGNIGAGNLPQLWLLALWRTNGEAYVRDYVRRFFGDVEPQVRKEGAAAMVSLVVAGEFRMSIPASEYRVFNMMKKGAPVSFHCPDPVPTSEPRMSILRGSPNPNAARLLVNWLVSKEGQIALHAVTSALPVHKDLQLPELVPFPEQVLNRNYAVRTDESLVEDHPKLLAIWNDRWGKGGGEIKGAGGGEE